MAFFFRKVIEHIKHIFCNEKIISVWAGERLLAQSPLDILSYGGVI